MLFFFGYGAAGLALFCIMLFLLNKEYKQDVVLVVLSLLLTFGGINLEYPGGTPDNRHSLAGLGMSLAGVRVMQT